MSAILLIFPMRLTSTWGTPHATLEASNVLDAYQRARRLFHRKHHQDQREWTKVDTSSSTISTSSTIKYYIVVV